MKFVKILCLFFLQFMLISGLWAVDIGASGMVWDAIYGQSQAQGLGFVHSANTHYHIGLMLIYVSFLIQLCWLLYFILKRKKPHSSLNNENKSL